MTAMAANARDSVVSFFTNPKNSVANILNKTGDFDKVVKTALSVLLNVKVACELINQSVTNKEKQISATFIEGVDQLTTTLKTTRMVIGLSLAWRGMLTYMYHDIRNLSIASQYINPTTTTSRKPLGKDELKSIKKDARLYLADEKIRICNIVKNFFQLISHSTVFVAFGALRPTLFVHKHFKILGNHAKQLGKTFCAMMLVNNLGGVVSNGAGVLEKSFELIGLAEELDIDSRPTQKQVGHGYEFFKTTQKCSANSGEYAKLHKATVKGLVVHIVDFFGKTANTVESCVTLFLPSAPIYVQMPIKLVIGVFDMTSVIIKTVV